MAARALILLAISALVLAGCTTTPPGTGDGVGNNTGGTTPGGSNTGTGTRAALTFVATEYNFSGPATAAPGWADITLRNSGQMPHHAEFFFIGNHTLAELQTIIAAEMGGEAGGNMSQGNGSMIQGNGTAMTGNETGNDGMMEGDDHGGMPSWLVAMGGPNAIDLGTTATATVELKAGNYAIVCFIPGPDGWPHVAHGMAKLLTVTGTPTNGPAPAADVQLVLSDFKFVQTPAAPAAGRHTVHVTSSSARGDHHEAQLIKLRGNATVMEFINSTSGPITGSLPAQLVCGMAGLGEGGEGWFTADLSAGRYAYLCFEGNPPHFTKGMIQEFTVA
jgi:hypothetical protein